MAQTNALVQTLKRALKAHGKTYADAAHVLGLTETSVKRLFSEQSFSLARLDQVCQMIGMEISDLVKMMEEQSSKLEQLTKEQEQEISKDVTLLLVAVCVLSRWTMPQIIDFYHIDEMECIQKLAYLDRLNIIELLPKNKIKLKVSPNFSWLENGPIQQFFQDKIAKEYFDTRFKNEGEQLVVLNGMLSKASNNEFQRKMKRLAKEFEELNQEDVGLPLEQRDGVTVLLAMRGWDYGLFKPMIK
ncbi:Cro/C1-type helix-turn-helix DNA-binding protein [Sinobacterium caligoides]|uniref:Cro/C1-type helix-turn-helix DNA-binding protein n=1 Tax=Sinobacterium caligoides TaxID=933926 RepID=A0A3N2DKP1_9GAMM|nr:helix-turn-helix transcriptional regulator [Sinobacterium caligoides]ROS00356.1 Cro/C1-type helix-turn-helix DNA-binding protein [Sinobacterium caligoides]